MLIEFALILIPAPEYTISLVDYFVWLQFFLYVWKVRHIELLFGSLWVEWDPLLHLGLKLGRWLVLIVVYELDYLVGSRG